MTEGYPLAGKAVSLSSETLCQYLVDAETRTQASRDGITDSPEPGVELRKWSSSPPEELAPEHEEAYGNREAQVAQNAEDEDSLYTESMSSSKNSS